MFKAIPPKYAVKMTMENEMKIAKSLMEAATIDFRPVFCCYCGTFLFEVGDDIIGHIAVKCQKCKGVVPLNAAYFHRSDVIAIMKRNSQYIVPLSEIKN